MATLQRIGVGSAFKVGVVVYGLLFLVFGGLGLLCNLALVAPAMSTAFMLNGEVVSSRELLGSFGALGVGALCLTYAIGAVASAFGGGLSLALMALFYNWAVRWVGGLELEIVRSGIQSDVNILLGEMRSGMR